MTSPDPRLVIGGEIELSVADLARDDGDLPAVPARFPTGLWLDSARSGLRIAAAGLHERGARRAWLPAFACEAAVSPFIRAGFEVRYYPVAAELSREGCALPAAEAGDVVLFVHYFGLRNARAVGDARRLRDRGVWLVEDAAQASLTSGLGEVGHVLVTSHRKLCAAPDGGWFGTALDLDITATAADEAMVSARIVGKLLRGARAAAASFLPLIERSERVLDEASGSRRISWAGERIIRSTDWSAVAAARRANWQGVARALAGIPALVPLFAGLGDGEVPLGFPVRAVGVDRDVFRRALAAREIFCPVHWSIDHVPRLPELEPDHALSRQVITFPVDQRMGEAHVARLGRAVVDALQEIAA